MSGQKREYGGGRKENMEGAEKRKLRVQKKENMEGGRNMEGGGREKRIGNQCCHDNPIPARQQVLGPHVHQGGESGG